MSINNDWKHAFYDDENFAETMHSNVEPWLTQCVVHKYFYSTDGVKLSCYYALNPKRGKSITMVHGYGEFWGKYHEAAHVFYTAGYSVFFLELRGHGLSQHLVDNKDLIHVEDFNDYLDDVLTFQYQIVQPLTRGDVHILFGHSMGGCVSALFLEKFPTFFDKGILSSPMLELDFGDTSKWKLDALAMVSGTELVSTRPAPGAKPFDPEPHPEKSSCVSYERFMYQFNMRLKDTHYQTWGGTMGWARAARYAVQEVQENAADIQVPVLILQAEHDHMVLPGGQRLVASKAKKASIITIPDSRHEIFNALKDARWTYWTTIFTFLETPVEQSL